MRRAISGDCARKKRGLQAVKPAEIQKRNASHREVVVFDLDYDGCGNCLTRHLQSAIHLRGSATERQRIAKLVERFYSFAHSNQGERNLLLCGSARQDYRRDIVNWCCSLVNTPGIMDSPADGLILHEFRKLAQDLRFAGVGNLELCELLFADGEERIGISWEQALAKHQEAYCGGMTKKLGLAYLNGDTAQAKTLISKLSEDTRDVSINKAVLQKDKVSLLEYQIMRLRQELGTDTLIHVYFFDDKDDILKALATTLLPPRVKLTRVRFNWYDYVFNGSPLNVAFRIEETIPAVNANRHSRQIDKSISKNYDGVMRKTLRTCREKSVINEAKVAKRMSSRTMKKKPCNKHFKK